MTQHEWDEEIERLTSNAHALSHLAMAYKYKPSREVALAIHKLSWKLYQDIEWLERRRMPLPFPGEEAS